MSWDIELDSQLEDINDSSLLGQNIPEPWENWGDGDCREALNVPDSCEDVVENSSSSSFGDTAAAASIGEPEVESRMFADNASSLMFDDGHEPLRPRKKRQTTAHWRRFINPVMSRCKWVELQLKQLKSQECKYAEELAALDCTQDMKKDMKRKRRKKVEENCDLASYMSNHTLFSYYEKAYCNVDAGLEDCHEVFTGGDSKNSVEFKSDDLWSSLGNYGNDKSWDDAIQKIVALESQLQKLKSRHDKVISENQGRFCSVNQSSMLGPADEYNHPDINPDSFTGNASSGEATNRPQMDDPRDNINFEDLTQYQAVNEELHELVNVGNQLVKQIESFGEIKETFKLQGSESDSYENVVQNVNVRANLKSCSTLKSKNRRHERKREKKSASKRSRRSG